MATVEKMEYLKNKSHKVDISCKTVKGPIQMIRDTLGGGEGVGFGQSVTKYHMGGGGEAKM